MPPILMAFFLLLGATTGPPAVKALVTPKDASTRPKWGEPAPQEYRTWASSVAPGRQSCEVTYFALATRNRATRLRAGGVEQLLDWSWSFARTLQAGERHTLALEFLDPRHGTRLACHEQTATCDTGYVAAERATAEGRCAPDALAPGVKGGKPRLTARTAPFTMYDPAIGGAFVDVEFQITGDVDEEWYCPAIMVEWPDDTRAFRESDCPPFADRDREHRFKWKFNHGFPGGEWRVKGCLTKPGKLLACETVLVRVVGGGE